MRSLLVISITLLFTLPLKAQEWGWRSITIPYTQDTITVDSLSIIPGTFSVATKSGLKLDSSDYFFNPITSSLQLKTDPGDSLILFYRVFPLNFNKVYQRRIYQEPPLDVDANYNPFTIQAIDEKQDIFLTEGLNKNGSISRGVSIGNNQDLVVNSNLDLQLSGRVSENINLLAAISDNNIPIQPDGNTQQLQDFDQVYIQLFDDDWKLTAGDFQLTSPPSHFMQFFKRAQGGSFSAVSKPFSNDTSARIFYAASGAVSKGKFARNSIPGVEGNQGPYRLSGNENETFIIVLSGTERVFLDGELLMRGQEYDYVIDYNTAEVTFTARRLITKDRRIVVEFQYSDRSYARSLLFSSVGFSNERSLLQVNFYNEQDSRNQSLQQDLDIKHKQFMAGIGDDLSGALFTSIDTAEFQNDRILYQLKDTLVGSITYDSVLVFSASADTNLYKAVFSKVGQGNGNYEQVSGTANGKIFRWIAPVNGVPQGEFEPVVLLITPKKRQMATINFEHKLTKIFSSGGEFAYSENDLNTFSDLDEVDDKDIAYRVWVAADKKAVDTAGWNLRSMLRFEQVNNDFTGIERFRPVEFERDWNLTGRELSVHQHQADGELILQKRNRYLRYIASAMLMDSLYQGVRQNADIKWNTRRFSHDAMGSVLLAEGFGEASKFLRWRSRSVKKTKIINPGFSIDTEWNERRGASDTLAINSYLYHDLEAFIEQNESSVNRFHLGYRQRSDYAPIGDNFLRYTFAETFGASYELLKYDWTTLRLTSQYRKLAITNETLTKIQPENTLIGRLEYTARMLKGSIITDTYYETGSGLEQRKDFTYVEVAAGQGSYAYLGDLNGNSIKDINEFDLARYPDQARYIRVFTPTLEYIRTYSNQFSQSIQLSPDRVWATRKGIKKLVSRFAVQSAFRVERKTTREDGADRFNPLPDEISDSTLVSTNSSFRNVTSFNRSSPVYGIDHTWQDVRGKTLLVNGFETRTNQTQSVKGRVNISRRFLLTLDLGTGIKTSSNQFSGDRNFNIFSDEIKPRLSYQPSTSFRTSVSFRYSEKENRTEAASENLTSYDAGLEFRYSTLSKGSFTLDGNYILHAFDGKNGTVASYEMLEGLQPGQNVTWNLIYQRNISKHLQLNLSYHGRISETSAAVHTGSVQVRAYF